MEEKKASIGRLSVEVQEGRDILTREDTDKLFELFAFYRPKDPRLRDNALRAVWALTLAPYSVDDVREFENKEAFPESGEDGVIYIATDTNLTYRWSGTQYVEISPSLALGETSSTAYPGDKGKIAYEHSQIKSGNPHGTTAADVGAAPESHTTVKASASQLGHIKAGTGFSVGEDGTLTLATIDGGTFE